MIEPGSLLGFAIVLVLATWMASALSCGALLAGRSRLRRLGPRAERRAAALSLVLPVALGAVLTGGLAAYSLFGTTDHCLHHFEHAHLCLRHDTAWPAPWWAVALIAAVGGLLLARIAGAVVESWSAARRLRALRAVSTERAMGDGTVVLCGPSRQPYCFTAGLRTPRIYVGSAALEQLGPREQEAMVAHERAHVAFGDIWRGGALALLAVVGVPGLAAAAVRLWHDAGERLCDRVAADEVGSPSVVASAILAFARAPALAEGRAFAPRPGQIAERVEAVLGAGPVGDRTARRLGLSASALFAVAAVAAVALVEPLHHLIETLLGSM